MNGAVYDAVHNLYFKLRYSKLYDAVLATPLSAPDAAVGETTWALLRGASYSAAFLVIMAILIGFAFAAVGLAATALLRSWEGGGLVGLAGQARLVL